jgi:hypothetical protein
VVAFWRGVLDACGVAGAGGAATGVTSAALGDSYSSGVGTASYTLDKGCKRCAYGYPYLWTQKHPGTALSFVACSGAKTSDLPASQILVYEESMRRYFLG